MEVRNAKVDDIHEYVFKLGREIDIEEALVGGEFKTKDELAAFLIAEIRNIKVAFDGETMICIGGYDCYQKEQDLWSVWMLLTNAVEQQERHKFKFLRWSKKYLRNLKKELGGCVVFMNQVYLKNKLHVKWLSWLGAKWIPVGDEENSSSSSFLLFVL